MSEDMLRNLDIGVRDVKERMERGEKFALIDVREPWEHQIAHIEGARLIPMAQIPSKVEELEELGDIVLFCHHGMRSVDAAAWLRSQGVMGAKSMAGGIERWSVEIDPSVPRY
jgi:rhodanese-related sulfurtransferase